MPSFLSRVVFFRYARRMVARILFLFALLLPAPAMAETLEGSWAFEVEGTVIFRFDIAPAGKDGEWRGTWNKPGSFASDGNNFQQLAGPPEQVKSMAGLEFDHEVELSFNDPRPDAIPDIFRFRLIDSDAAEMDYVGTDLAPYILERVSPATKLGPWDAERTYSRGVPAGPNAPEVVEQLPAPVPPPVDSQGFRLPPGGAPTR